MDNSNNCRCWAHFGSTQLRFTVSRQVHKTRRAPAEQAQTSTEKAPFPKSNGSHTGEPRAGAKSQKGVILFFRDPKGTLPWDQFRLDVDHSLWNQRRPLAFLSMEDDNTNVGGVVPCYPTVDQ